MTPEYYIVYYIDVSEGLVTIAPHARQEDLLAIAFTSIRPNTCKSVRANGQTNMKDNFGGRTTWRNTTRKEENGIVVWVVAMIWVGLMVLIYLGATN